MPTRHRGGSPVHRIETVALPPGFDKRKSPGVDEKTGDGPSPERERRLNYRRSRSGLRQRGREVEVQRRDSPLAYHITWTAYGTWLSGDERGWVERGAPEIQKPAPRREDLARYLMAGEPVILTPEQRAVVLQTIKDHCAIRRWTLHAVNVRTTHAHVVVTADRSPEEVMNQLKSWCSRRLNERWSGRKKWWTYHGSTKWVWDQAYFDEAVDYVVNRIIRRSPERERRNSNRRSRSGLRPTCGNTGFG